MSLPGITGALVAASTGGGTPTIALSNVTARHTSGGILGANASYLLSNDGAVRKIVNATAYAVGTWDSIPATVADYEAKATVVSGALTSGTTGSWLNLATTRTWNVQATAGNYNDCVLTVEIRPAGGGSTLATATITIIADAT